MKILNIIYYFSWRFMLWCDKLLDKVVVFTLKPFEWLSWQIPYVRNRNIELYGSIKNAKKAQRDAAIYVMRNPEWGFAMQFAWGLYGGVLILFFWGVYFITSHYVPILLIFSLSNKYLVGLVSVALAGVVTHYASFRKDRYKKYFKEFDKLKGLERWLYKLMTLAIMIGICFFWYWTMAFAHHK